MCNPSLIDLDSWHIIFLTLHSCVLDKLGLIKHKNQGKNIKIKAKNHQLCIISPTCASCQNNTHLHHAGLHKNNKSRNKTQTKYIKIKTENSNKRSYSRKPMITFFSLEMMMLFCFFRKKMNFYYPANSNQQNSLLRLIFCLLVHISLSIPYHKTVQIRVQCTLCPKK